MSVDGRGDLGAVLTPHEVECRSGDSDFFSQLACWAGAGSAEPALEELGELFAERRFNERRGVMHYLDEEPIDVSSLPTPDLRDTVLFPDECATLSVSRTDPLLRLVELGDAVVQLGDGPPATMLRGHNRTWKDAQAGWILRELRRVGSKDPVIVLDEIDKIGTAPTAVLLEVLDPAQNAHFRDAFVELPFDLSEVLFITTANEVSRIPPGLRDRLEVVELPGYSEDEKVAIGETHLVAAQNRTAGLTATPVRFTRGALRRIIREYTSEQGIRRLARRLQGICRKVALGLETGDASLVRKRVTVRQVHAFLGAPRIDHTDGADRLGAELAAPSLPAAVRERGRQVLARLSAWSPTDPEHGRAREYQRCLAGVPWTMRTETTLDLARSRAVLDAGHAGHGAVKERLLDYVAVRLANPAAPSGVLCLLGPPGVGKSSLARLVAGALGRPCAWWTAARWARRRRCTGPAGMKRRSSSDPQPPLRCHPARAGMNPGRSPCLRRRCRPPPRARGAPRGPCGAASRAAPTPARAGSAAGSSRSGRNRPSGASRVG